MGCAGANQGDQSIYQGRQVQSWPCWRVRSESAQMSNDLKGTEEDPADSKKFSAELEVNCENRECTECMKMQVEEMFTLAGTIKVLNDDDPLESFNRYVKVFNCQTILEIPRQIPRTAKSYWQRSFDS